MSGINLVYINKGNLEAFQWNILLSSNLLFLKSEVRISPQNTYYLLNLNPKMSVNQIEPNDIEEKGTEIGQPKNNLKSQTSTKTIEQQENTLSSWHYISWIFGVILTCGTISIITLIPSKNILIEPNFWYESVILIPTIGWIPLWITVLIFQLEFWSNITYSKSISTWIYLFVIGVFAYIFTLLSYRFLWTAFLGFYQPAPFSGYLCGSNMIFMLFAATWFRSGISYQKKNCHKTI